jgi:3-phenylpropionate/trans-cinnamate dioxygenase ferredoxin component
MAFEVVATLDEIEVGETLLVELAEPICLVRLGETDVRAVHDTCTHQQQPLHEGTVDDDTLVCAAHAATFDLDTGESIGVPDVAAIAVYACKVEDDCVLVDLDRRRNAAG